MTISIHRIYARISPFFRRRRMRDFADRFGPNEETAILDVGGYPRTWEGTALKSRITVLNIHPIDLSAVETGRPIEAVVGDACHLEYHDRAFDIVFSNSVIEHVGAFDRQELFAAEVKRVGAALWIQTPARSFFIEPHLLTPLIHFLPRSVQRRLLRHFTIWGLMTKPTPNQVDEFLTRTRLLNKSELKQLFPDCEILHERVLGLTKSYVVVRGAGQ